MARTKKYVREKGIKENTFRYWLKSTYKHLLTEMPKHIYDKDKSYVLDLLPWSDKLPSEVKTDTE